MLLNTFILLRLEMNKQNKKKGDKKIRKAQKKHVKPETSQTFEPMSCKVFHGSSSGDIISMKSPHI